MNDKYFKSMKKIKSLAEGHGYCFVSSKVSVEENEIKYCYREKPTDATDSGWRFMAGDEDKEYCSNGENFQIYDVNTVCNFDRSIIDIIDTPYPVDFIKKGSKFVIDDESDDE